MSNSDLQNSLLKLLTAYTLLVEECERRGLKCEAFERDNSRLETNLAALTPLALLGLTVLDANKGSYLNRNHIAAAEYGVTTFQLRDQGGDYVETPATIRARELLKELYKA